MHARRLLGDYYIFSDRLDDKLGDAIEVLGAH
jgi:hypothetical protein